MSAHGIFAGALLWFALLAMPVQAQLRQSTSSCTTYRGEPGELLVWIADQAPASEVADRYAWGAYCSVATDVAVQHALVTVTARPGVAEILCSDRSTYEPDLLSFYEGWKSGIGNLANVVYRDEHSRQFIQVWPSRFIDDDWTPRVEWSC